MVRAVPGARERLQRLLASPRRPTWVVQWQHPDRWQLDPGGRTKRLLRRGYRRAAVVCGHAVYVRNDRPRTAAAGQTRLCGLRRAPHRQPAARTMTRAWIVIPTYNEAENLVPLIAAVRAAHGHRRSGRGELDPRGR